MVPWPTLGLDLRESNRDQARDIQTKLGKIGCFISMDAVGMFAFALTWHEVEALSHDEHRRWTTHLLAAGWSHGPVRDDRAKRHPSLVPWDLLSEAERDKDRDVVHTIPVVLAAAGLTPQRY
jgi:hypothetical protein